MYEFSDIRSVLEGLKNGEMIVLIDDPDRENEGDLVMIAEHVNAEAINFMAQYGRGLICMPMGEQLIKKIDLPPMSAHNSDIYHTAFTVSIDYDNGSTGISAYDRAQTIKMACSEEAKPEWFKRPGHIFPLAANSGGVRVRRGHTEASVELAKLAGYKEAAVICEILNPDGTMARTPELMTFAKTHGLKIATIESLVNYVTDVEDHGVTLDPAVHMPMLYGNFKMRSFTENKTGKAHLLLTLGEPENQVAPLVRVHSECFTGDVLGSKRCDCGEQLHKSLALMQKEGHGILIYLKQEGRGIGLVEKLKAYALQESGHDTISANTALGHGVDERHYNMAADALKAIGVSEIRLITNNPNKRMVLESEGVSVSSVVHLPSTVTPENENYLRVKVEEMGHDISLM